MWTWFKQLFDRIRAEADADAREALARAELDRLRREELSVGAQMRLGLPVTSAPGQVFSSVTSPGPSTSSARASATGSADLPAPREDFETSLVVGLATASFAAGYGAGGSIAGASIGKSIADGSQSTD